MKNLFNFLRSLKSKLTIDNCFDGFFGGILAVIALYFHYILSIPLIFVAIIPIVLSELNEFVNMYCGEKYFSFVDVFFRSIIPILLYLILAL